MTLLSLHHVAIICADSARSRRFTFFADPDGLPLELYESGEKAACMSEKHGDED